MVNFVKELKCLLTTVSKKFQPLPDVEGGLAERLFELYVCEKTKERFGSSEDETLAEKVAAVTLSSCEDGSRDTPTTRLNDGIAAVAERDSSCTDQAETPQVGEEGRAENSACHIEQTSPAKPQNDVCGTESACGSVAPSEKEEWSSDVKKAAVSFYECVLAMACM